MISVIQKLKKRITLPIAFVSFCLFTLTIGQFLPIEISLPGLSFVFYCIIIIGLPIVSVKQLRKRFAKMQNPKHEAALKLVCGFILLVYILVALFLCMGNTICRELTDRVLFINKDRKSSKIIVRHFDCGATDSGVEKYEVVKVIDVFSVFNYVTKVDTTKIDKTVWVRVIATD